MRRRRTGIVRRRFDRTPHEERRGREPEDRERVQRDQDDGLSLGRVRERRRVERRVDRDADKDRTEQDERDDRHDERLPRPVDLVSRCRAGSVRREDRLRLFDRLSQRREETEGDRDENEDENKSPAGDRRELGSNKRKLPAPQQLTRWHKR